jgi:hypothetical protein
MDLRIVQRPGLLVGSEEWLAVVAQYVHDTDLELASLALVVREPKDDRVDFRRNLSLLRRGQCAGPWRGHVDGFLPFCCLHSIMLDEPGRDILEYAVQRPVIPGLRYVLVEQECESSILFRVLNDQSFLLTRFYYIHIHLVCASLKQRLAAEVGELMICVLADVEALAGGHEGGTFVRFEVLVLVPLICGLVLA